MVEVILAYYNWWALLFIGVHRPCKPESTQKQSLKLKLRADRKAYIQSRANKPQDYTYIHIHTKDGSDQGAGRVIS